MPYNACVSIDISVTIKTMRMKKHDSISGTAGFTIIELLVVIVIIAILATISVFAYNGVQQRAADSSVLSTVKVWEKLLMAYKNDKGTYPLSSDGCVGANSSDFPAMSGLAQNECTKGFPRQPNVSRTYSDMYLGRDLRTVLAPTSNPLPAANTALVTGTVGGTDIRSRGIYLYPGSSSATLEYYVNGSDCGSGKRIDSGTITRCQLTLN